MWKVSHAHSRSSIRRLLPPSFHPGRAFSSRASSSSISFLYHCYCAEAKLRLLMWTLKMPELRIRVDLPVETISCCGRMLCRQESKSMHLSIGRRYSEIILLSFISFIHKYCLQTSMEWKKPCPLQGLQLPLIACGTFGTLHYTVL